MILFTILNFILLLCSAQGKMCKEAGRANSSKEVDYNLRGEPGQAYSLEIFIGTPQQKLSVIVDTGSTTLAVAAYPRRDSNIYFHSNESSSYLDGHEQLSAKYSQGFWSGRLAKDVIFIPSLPLEPQIRAPFAIIENSYDFFTDGCGWQGLMGFGYYPVMIGIESSMVRSWLDSLNRQEKKTFSFELKLCGADINLNNVTHYGSLTVSDDPMAFDENNNPTEHNSFRTPVLRRLWYEIGVLGIHVLKPNYDPCAKDKPNLEYPLEYPDLEQCKALNAGKSIIDSGTTYIRLPDAVFEDVASKMLHETQFSRDYIPEEFWTKGTAVCYNERQDWNGLPWIGIDLLHIKNDSTFFTLMLPPENYIRVVSAYESDDNVTDSQFCYLLGVEAGGVDTILGYTAMEGLDILFNRSAGWISIKSGNCGPNAHVIGPFTTNFPIRSNCNLLYSSEVAFLIKLAYWTLLVMITIGIVVITRLFLHFDVFKIWTKSTGPAQDTLAQQELI